MKWITEIRKVGISDWCWFVLWLGRDEFSNKLDFWRWDDYSKLWEARARAHRVDLELRGE